jgi:tRNA A-37 threonylcarbamoyl transferase component Bud32
VRRLEQACDRFEAAWKAGERPRLEDHLAAVPEPERPALLRELIPLEVDYRRLAGEQPAAEEFLARFPALDRAWIAGLLSATAPTLLRRAPAGPESSGLSGDALPPPQPSPLRLQPALPPGAVPGSSGDIRGLLRTRLRFISLVVFALSAYGLIAFGLSLLRSYDFYAAEWSYTPPAFLIFFTAMLLAAVLWTKRPLSLRQLRGIELTIFGLFLVALDWGLFCDLFSSPPFPGAARWERTAEEEIFFLNLYGTYSSVTFALLIVCYATLIPSDWRRCTLVVGTMALTPLTIAATAGVFVMPDPGAFFRYYVLPLGIILAIAVALAAYGTHRIELLRQEAARARQLGQYQLRQRLGSGGMGEVYLAEHVLLKQPCAVKLIRVERAGDPATLRRFEREVQATARLKHWNTVQIFDYGRAADGTFYYVMEYLPGITLEQLVKQHGPLPPGRAVHLLRQACLALREAHALGLIHRDVKPGNIMVCERGGVADVVKLLDFGLVKAVGPTRPEETLTQEGAIAGTPAYMSPEQASGTDHLDGRSDIYSLGAVAYFLLTGQPPFPRDRAIEAIVAHLHEPVRPLTRLREEVPADLEEVVLCCLQKDPGRRFADVGRLHEALASFACPRSCC